MRWAEHVARKGDERDASTVLVEKPNRKTQQLSVDERIILK
jgi:hypothetical protein